MNPFANQTHAAMATVPTYPYPPGALGVGTQHLQQAPQPVDQSEIDHQLMLLSSQVERLAGLRERLNARLLPISRGLPPTADAKQVAPVIGSQVGRYIAELRGQIATVNEALDAEICALAI